MDFRHQDKTRKINIKEIIFTDKGSELYTHTQTTKRYAMLTMVIKKYLKPLHSKLQ